MTSTGSCMRPLSQQRKRVVRVIGMAAAVLFVIVLTTSLVAKTAVSADVKTITGLTWRNPSGLGGEKV